MGKNTYIGSISMKCNFGKNMFVTSFSLVMMFPC